jgi:hypothetical protein
MDPDPRRISLVAVDDAGPGRVEVVPPGEEAAVHAPGRLLPLDLVREPVGEPRLPRQPAGVRAGAVPVDQHHGPVGAPGLSWSAVEGEAPSFVASVGELSLALGERSPRERAGREGLVLAPLGEQIVEEFQVLGVCHRVSTQDKRVDPEAPPGQHVHGQQVAAGPAPARGDVDLPRGQRAAPWELDGPRLVVARPPPVPVSVALDQDRVAHLFTTRRPDPQQVRPALQRHPPERRRPPLPRRLRGEASGAPRIGLD